MLARDGHDGIHICHFSKEMNGNDGTGPLVNGLLNTHGIEVKSPGVNVYKHWSATQASNRASSSKKGIRSRNDLIARLDADRHQRNQNSVGTRGDSDCMLTLAIFGDLTLQGFNFRA